MLLVDWCEPAAFPSAGDCSGLRPTGRRLSVCTQPWAMFPLIVGHWLLSDSEARKNTLPSVWFIECNNNIWNLIKCRWAVTLSLGWLSTYNKEFGIAKCRPLWCDSMESKPSLLNDDHPFALCAILHCTIDACLFRQLRFGIWYSTRRLISFIKHRNYYLSKLSYAFWRKYNELIRWVLSALPLLNNDEINIGTEWEAKYSLRVTEWKIIFGDSGAIRGHG